MPIPHGMSGFRRRRPSRTSSYGMKMKSGILVLVAVGTSLLGTTDQCLPRAVDAFFLPQKKASVRRTGRDVASPSRLNAEESESFGDAVRGVVKFILVPNAKKSPPRSSSSSSSSSSVDEALSSTPVAPEASSSSKFSSRGDPLAAPGSVDSLAARDSSAREVESVPVDLGAPSSPVGSDVTSSSTFGSQFSPPDQASAASVNVAPDVPSPGTNFVPDTPIPIKAPPIDDAVMGGSSAQMVSVDQVVEQLQQRYQDTLSIIQSAPREPGKAPMMMDYLLEGKFYKDGGILQETQERIKSLPPLNFQSLKDMKMTVLSSVSSDESGVPDILQYSSLQVEKLMLSFTALGELLTSGSTFTAKEVLDVLDVNELGIWYLGAFTATAAAVLSTSQNTRKEVELDMRAAEQPQEPMTVDDVANDKAKLEASLTQLTEITSALSKELTELKTEKLTRDYEVLKMKSDLKDFQNQLEGRRLSELDLKMSLEETEETMKNETAQLREQIGQLTEVERNLRKRLSETESQLKNETAQLREQIGQLTEVERNLREKLSETESQLKDQENLVKSLETVVAEKKSIESQMNELQKENEILKVQLGRGINGHAQLEEADDEEAIVAEEMLNVPFMATLEDVEEVATERTSKPKATAKKSAKKASSKRATKKAAANKAVENENVPSTRRMVLFWKNGSQGRKRTAKSSTQASAAAETEKADLQNWSSLARTTLKRKRVKELQEYLEARGAEVTDDNGKPLKKDLLVDAVLTFG